MRKIRIDMMGNRYGRLVAIAFAHRSPSGHAHWLFACDCGAELVAAGGNVRAGTTTSCGCRHREISAARLTTHGHRAARRHGPTYRAWQQMNDACRNPNCAAFAKLGARGVTVCAGWRSDFEAFLADMGERPTDTVLERIDAAAAFGPDNCHWRSRPLRARRAEKGWENGRAGTIGDALPIVRRRKPDHMPRPIAP